MPRKNNEDNPLEIRLRVKSLPRVSQRAYFQRLLDFIVEKKPLPAKWDIELHWRNRNTRHGVTSQWRSDGFEDAILESRGGFVVAVEQAIRRRLRML